MEAVENIRNTIKLYIRKARKVKVNYYFGFIILLSWFLFGTSFTTLFGGWIVYNPPVQDKYATVKVGLFNSAVNEQWKVFWHSTCVEQAKTEKKLSVCNARLSIGVLLIFSLIAAFATASLLSVMATKFLPERRIAQAKLAVMGLFAFSALINIISFSVGSGIMYSTISSDENILNPAYGVGFYFSIINSCLFCLLIPAVYLMVSSDGVIQDKPRPKSRQIRSMLFTAGEDKQPSMSTLSSIRSGSSRITPSQRTYGDTIRSERSITSESSNAISDYSSRSKKTDRYQRLQDAGTSKPSKLANSIDREERRTAPKELPAIPERTHTSKSKKPMQSTLRIKTEYTDELEQTSRRNRSTDRTRSTRGNGARTADDAKILHRKKSERRPVDGSRKPGRNPSDRSLKSAPESKRSMSGRAEIEMDDFASSTMSDFDDFLKSFDK